MVRGSSQSGEGKGGRIPTQGKPSLQPLFWTGTMEVQGGRAVDRRQPASG